MTNLEKLIKASGNAGGTVADFDRRFSKVLDGRTLAALSESDLFDLASACVAIGDYEGAQMLSRAWSAGIVYG